jgi:hypothetical protein
MTKWSDIKISFGGDVRWSECRKPAPVEPPAKYESKGTWFERCALAGHNHRAVECPMACGRAWTTFHVMTSVPYSAYDAHGAKAFASGRTFEQAQGRAERRAMSQVKVELGYNATGNNVARTVKITTPVGKVVTAEEAAEAVDALTEAQRRCAAAVASLESVARVADEYRVERDKALGYVETHRRERDEARAKLAAVRMAFIAYSGASPYPAHVTLQQLRDALSAALGKSTFAERLSTGCEGATPVDAKPVGWDKPVTLGMLSEISAEAARIGDERWEAKRLENFARRGRAPSPRPPTVLETYGATPMQEAIGKKLGR